MKRVLYFLSDNSVPTDEELQECINIKKVSDSVICLKWFFPYNGWHELWFEEGSQHWSIQDCREKMPKIYGV